MRHNISKKERALLTLAGAQRLAGPGATPSARQVRRAHDEAGCSVARRGVVVKGGADATDGVVDKICGVLSGIGGETDAECGNFWSKVKSFATSATTKAAPLAPLFGPTAMVAVPVAQQMMKKSGGSAPAQSEESLQDIFGFGPERQMVEDYTYIFGHGNDDEDEMILGEGSGAAEAAALRRRHQSNHIAGYQPEWEFSLSAGTVPHETYRAAILRSARKLGGKKPSAKQISQAQAAVDRALRSRGLFVAIPGARPGRVTR